MFTKKQLKNYCKSVLHKYKLNDKLNTRDFNQILSILKNHPSYLFKTEYKEVVGIKVKLPPYNTLYTKHSDRCFYLCLSNNKEVEISYLNAIDKPNKKTRLIKHFRKIVYDQIVEFRKNTKCKDDQFYHVDHVYPFEKIVTDFLSINQIDLNKLDLFQFEHFKNDYSDKFYNYHKEKATLQYLLPEDNYRKSNKII